MGENKSKNKICTAIWILFIATFAVSILHSCVRISDIYNERSGADKIRTELTDAGGKLEEQAGTITDAIGTVEEAQRTVDAITRTEQGDEAIISECRRILTEIRRRGETEGNH